MNRFVARTLPRMRILVCALGRKAQTALANDGFCQLPIDGRELDAFQAFLKTGGTFLGEDAMANDYNRLKVVRVSAWILRLVR